MCYACYEKCGKPSIVNEATQKAADLVGAVYQFNQVGGNAHIVLDDFNIEDSSIDWCLTEGLQTNIHEHDAGQLQIERECLECFKAMTVAERASALAICEGWI